MATRTTPRPTPIVDTSVALAAIGRVRPPVPVVMRRPVYNGACLSLTTVARTPSSTHDCMQAVVAVQPVCEATGVPEHVHIASGVHAALETVGVRAVHWQSPVQSHAYVDGTVTISRVLTPFGKTADVDFLSSLCAAVATTLDMDVHSLRLEPECALLRLKARGAPFVGTQVPELALPTRNTPLSSLTTTSALLGTVGLFPLVGAMCGLGGVEVMPAHRRIAEWATPATSVSGVSRRADPDVQVERELRRDRDRAVCMLRDGVAAGLVDAAGLVELGVDWARTHARKAARRAE